MTSNKPSVRELSDDQLQKLVNNRSTSWDRYDEARTELRLRRYEQDMSALIVGSGATYCIGTDRYAGTVIERTKDSITIQLDLADRIGESDYSYAYRCDDKGSVHKFTRRKDRRFVATNSQHGMLISGRHHYIDRSF